MEFEAGRFPLQTARRHQPPGNGLQIIDGFFVINLMNFYQARTDRQCSMSRWYCLNRELM